MNSSSTYPHGHSKLAKKEECFCRRCVGFCFILFVMFDFCSQGPAAEHRSRAQCSSLQRSRLSEHSRCPLWPRRPGSWTDPCTQNRFCKRILSPTLNIINIGQSCAHLSVLSLYVFQPVQPQQPESKPQPPARPPPPSVIPQAASTTPASSQPAAAPTNIPPPMAPQAQGPPYPTYQGYPGSVFKSVLSGVFWFFSVDFSDLSTSFGP